MEKLQQTPVDPDNHPIRLPETLALGGKTVPLETVHELLSTALWLDLWLALKLDHLLHIREDFETYFSNRKLAKAEAK
jgi:hypothetical protein